MVSANDIPPGQEGQITVKFNVGSSRRQVRQAVQVRTNVPDKELVTLTLRANVVVDVDVLPPNILRFERRDDRPQITIRNFTATPIEVLAVIPPSEYLTLVASASIIPPQGDIVVTAELSEDTPDGVLSEWAEVHTNLLSQPVVNIRVWANLTNEATP